MKYSFCYNDELYVPVMINGVEAFMETHYFVGPITVLVTIKKDDVNLPNTTITVNDVQYTTNSSAQISMTGENGTTENLHFYLSDNYHGDFDITFTASANNVVNLDKRVVAGSVEWGAIHSYQLKQLTIPNNVTVIKVTENRYYYSDGEDYAYGSVGICRGAVSNVADWYIKPSSQKILWSYSDTTQRTHYVGVTPNQIYTIYRVESSYTKIEWSDSINMASPEKTI